MDGGKTCLSTGDTKAPVEEFALKECPAYGPVGSEEKKIVAADAQNTMYETVSSN